MDRRQMDRLVGAIVGIVLLVGLVSVGQQLAADDPAMGHGSVPAIHIVGPLLLSLLVASVVAAAYAIIRTDTFEDADGGDSGSAASTAGEGETSETTSSEPSPDPDTAKTISQGERRVLDLLPEDERRILKPVIESPGITQTAVADRADYSRSKVSQTITGLEERGLLYRERQGRTYRVYPTDDIGDRH